MDPLVVKAMQHELSALDAKSAALRAVISLYKADGLAVATPGGAARVSAERNAPVERNTNAGMVLAVARELAMRSLDPVPTRDILEAVEGRGVSISGTVPQNVVSSILSRSNEFVSNGRSGWTLNENGPPEGGPDDEEVAAPSPNTFDL